MSDEPTAFWPTAKWDGARLAMQDDEIAVEYPLTLMVDGEEFATIVCSPSALDDLACGFLASEGVIRRYEDIRSMQIDASRGLAYVELVRKQSTAKQFYSKRMIGSCCGKSRQFYFHNDARTARTSVSRIQVAASACIRLLRQLLTSSEVFRRTGGVHNAALCSPDELLVARDDIGRHNALDKLFGHALRTGLRTEDKLIAFSGRLSSEVVLKASKIGVGVLLSKSAPSDLALKLADDLGITCAGFIRGEEMNVYTHPGRIVFPDQGGSAAGDA